MLGNSTVGTISALRVQLESRRKFRQDLLTVTVDLKKAVNSVHRDAVSKLLELRKLPARVVGLFTGLYSGNERHN